MESPETQERVQPLAPVWAQSAVEENSDKPMKLRSSRLHHRQARKCSSNTRARRLPTINR